MRKIPLVLLSMLCCAALPAFAGGGGDDGDWELGAYMGSSHPDSYNPLDPENGTLYGGRVGYFFTERWSVEGSFQFFGTEGKAAGQKVDVDLNALRVNGLMNFRAGKKFRWFLTLGLGSEGVKADDLDISEKDFGLNAGGGGRWYFGKQRHFALRADARWIQVDVGGDIDATQSNYEGTGGILWSFGGGPPPDSDSDGVPDKKDTCAYTPKGAVVDAAGCPQDSDGDKVYDGLDKCANTQRGWAVDSAGCPADADGDGVADMVDKCPATPKEVKVDATGCPTEDSDGDGIWDGGDRCPSTPKGVKVDPVGCPMDADGDGVWDGDDKCSSTPKGTKVDATGCPAPAEPPPPPPAPVIPESHQPLVLEGVTFAKNSADLTPESSVVLDRVAASLKEHPEVRLEIGGHTDSNGSPEHNKQLSEARAASVRTYLVNKGVPGGQLTTKGYGSQRPVADNNTDAGRALNRRVELSRIP
jgi:OOP family OmpA-OmpF porin